MELLSDTAELLEKIMCPAFIVRSGMIVEANQAALQRQIVQNTKVCDIIAIGADEYQMYQSGKLYLTLCINGIPYGAAITSMGNYHMFCLISDYEEPELRAFALAAMHLRDPLSNAMLSTEQLLPNPVVKEDAQIMQQLSQINRSLHQLLRAISNMSDTADYTNQRSFRFQARDIIGVMKEILEKVEGFVLQSGRAFRYDCPKQTAYGPVDAEKLERAILNMISNAIRYTPKGSEIHAVVRLRENKLIFTVQDNGNGIDAKVKSDLFSRFLREPGMDNGHNGIGLGLSIVRSVAAAHNGTVLMEQAPDCGTKFTMTIALTPSDKNVVRSPILLPVDYTGGRDRILLELSDVLPNTLYQDTV